MNIISGGSITKLNEYSSLKKKLWTVISGDLLMEFKEREMWGYLSGVTDASMGGVVSSVSWCHSTHVLYLIDCYVGRYAPRSCFR